MTTRWSGGSFIRGRRIRNRIVDQIEAQCILGRTDQRRGPNDPATNEGRNYMRTKFNLAMFLTGFAMTLHADSSQRGFTVSLRDCTELIGLGPVEFAKARSVVPIRYSLVPFNGSAGLVVR